MVITQAKPAVAACILGIAQTAQHAQHCMRSTDDCMCLASAMQLKHHWALNLPPAGGVVHIFAMDSDCNEPDGVTADSKQGQWLKSALASTSAPWKLVLLHHAPFSSGDSHGSHPHLQWPFERWGADAVLSGHDHVYERILIPGSGMPYFVNGLGGFDKNGFNASVSGGCPCSSLQVERSCCSVVVPTAMPACTIGPGNGGQFNPGWHLCLHCALIQSSSLLV